MSDMFIKLPFDIKHVPSDSKVIEAYCLQDKVIVPILDPSDEHNCDWNGCSSSCHVEVFDIKRKYEVETENAKLKDQLSEALATSDLHNSIFNRIIQLMDKKEEEAK